MENRKISITTIAGTFNFVGVHMPEKQSENWHYYKTDKGDIIHFRKSNMVAVTEGDYNGDS